MALSRELAAQGLYQKATGRIILQLLLGVAVFAAGTAGFYLTRNLALRLVAIGIATLGSLIVATNTHSSSHNATSNTRWVNELLTFFGYPFFLGLSATYWWHKHIVVHHPAPNVVDVDEDLNLLPWFAVRSDEIDKSSGLRRLYYTRLQWWFLPIALAGHGFTMHVSGWSHLLPRLAEGKGKKRLYWLDLLSLTGHYVCWLAIPLIWFQPLDVLAFYVLRTVFMGYAMYAVLAPGHLPGDAAVLSSSAARNDYALLQTATTVNFRTRFLGRWLCSGLEYQIEHHLFPNVSHVHYRKVSVIVQRFCREHNLPYRCYGWGEAIWKSWLVMRQPKVIEAHLTRSSLQP